MRRFDNPAARSSVTCVHCGARGPAELSTCPACGFTLPPQPAKQAPRTTPADPPGAPSSLVASRPPRASLLDALSAVPQHAPLTGPEHPSATGTGPAGADLGAGEGSLDRRSEHPRRLGPRARRAIVTGVIAVASVAAVLTAGIVVSSRSAEQTQRDQTSSAARAGTACLADIVTAERSVAEGANQVATLAGLAVDAASSTTAARSVDAAVTAVRVAGRPGDTAAGACQQRQNAPAACVASAGTLRSAVATQNEQARLLQRIAALAAGGATDRDARVIDLLGQLAAQRGRLDDLVAAVDAAACDRATATARER